MCHSCLWKATYDGAWIRQELLDSWANDRQLGGKPGMPGFHFVPNAPKIRAQRPADMVALRAFRTHGTAFNATKLLEVAMLRLNRPNLAVVLRSFIVINSSLLAQYSVSPCHKSDRIAIPMCHDEKVHRKHAGR